MPNPRSNAKSELGINDDGSGTLSLLEIATHLTSFDVNNCVRFAWWAAEEEGLVGSDFYAASLSAEENRKVRLFMDYDMLVWIPALL